MWFLFIPDTGFLRKSTMRKNPAINASPVMVPSTIPAMVPDDRAVELDSSIRLHANYLDCCCKLHLDASNEYLLNIWSCLH